MRPNKKQLPILEHILITDVAAEGKALAKVDERVIFVPYVAPGDIVDIQLTKRKSSFAEGKAVKFHQYAPNRVEPFCSHFGLCGGCKWQHLPYEAQLGYKQQQVQDNLERIAKVELPPIKPIIGSDETTYYRNKLEFTFSNKRWLTTAQINENGEPIKMNGLGFHIPGMFDRVIDIENCFLQSELSNRIRLSIREFTMDNGYSYFNLRSQQGLMRTLTIRTSSTGETMVLVVFFEDLQEYIVPLMSHIADSFPEITSLLYCINNKGNDTLGDLDMVTFRGRDYIMESMEGLQFKIGPKSFYQTNSAQAHKLYSIVRDMAQLTGKELVYDLYTGTGTIAQFVAARAAKVIGIEYVPEAIEDAKINASLNKIEHVAFYAGDMKDILNEAFIAQNGRPDIVITDPPRAGMHPDVIQTIRATQTPKIVYVSCNPATQARDLALLDQDYRVVEVQPVDMFPHTHHVENVVLLERR